MPRRTNPANIHVRGYKERQHQHSVGLVICNQSTASTWRSTLSIASRYRREPERSSKGRLKGQIIESINYAYTEGLDKAEIRNWKWPSAR